MPIYLNKNELLFELTTKKHVHKTCSICQIQEYPQIYSINLFCWGNFPAGIFTLKNEYENFLFMLLVENLLSELGFYRDTLILVSFKSTRTLFLCTSHNSLLHFVWYS